jgi:F-type H+-transporting ATPase subunit b
VLLASNSNFLIPNWTFVAELLIFLVVVGVMALVVLPPLQKSLTDRQDGIRRSVQRADALRSEAAEATAERRRILGEAREQARSTVDGAIRAADEDRHEAQGRGQAENARLVAEARDVVEGERAAARREMGRNMGSLIAAAAERVIGSQVDPARHAGVVAEAVAAVERGAA